MSQSKVRLPNGKVITVKHPDGAKQEDIFGFAQRHYLDSLDPEDNFAVDIVKGVSSGALETVYNTMAGVQSAIPNIVPGESEWEQALIENAAAIRDWSRNTNDALGLDEDFANSFGGQVAKGFGQMPVQIGSTILGAVGGTLVAGPAGGVVGALAVGGGTMAAQMHTEAIMDAENTLGKKHMDFTQEEKDQTALSSLAYMTVGGILEYLPMTKFIPKELRNKIINFTKGKGKLTKPELDTAVKSLKREMAEGAIFEGATEAFQGQLLDGLASATYDEGRDLISADVLKQRGTEFLVGAIVGGGTTGVTVGGTRALTGKETAARTEEDIEGEKTFIVEFDMFSDEVGAEPGQPRPVQKMNKSVRAKTLEEAQEKALEILKKNSRVDIESFKISPIEDVPKITTETDPEVEVEEGTPEVIPVAQINLKDPNFRDNLSPLQQFLAEELQAEADFRNQTGEVDPLTDPADPDVDETVIPVGQIDLSKLDLTPMQKFMLEDLQGQIDLEINRLRNEEENAVGAKKSSIYERIRELEKAQAAMMGREYIPVTDASIDRRVRDTVIQPNNYRVASGSLNLPIVGASQARASQEQVQRAKATPDVTIPEGKVIQYNLIGSPFVTEYDGGPREPTQEFNFEELHYDLNNAEKKRLNDAIDSGAVQAVTDRLVEEVNKMTQEQGVSDGMGWYGRMRGRLKDVFGGDSVLFTHLLGATSSRTSVGENFIQAADAFDQYKQGKFKDNIKKYIELRALLSQNKLSETMIKRKIIQKGEKFSNAKLAERWIEHYNILPKRKNGQKYNANSGAVLKALSGFFIEGSPKTPQFAMNLNGESLEATIDVWAARTLRRITHGDKVKRWRILPSEETGVSAQDFAFGQLVFREAAQRLNMSPDDLQAVVWFGEKDVWGKNGWTNNTGAKKSSFDEAAEAFFPAGKPARSFEQGQNIVKFLQKEALYEYDRATENEFNKLDPKSKEYKNQKTNRRKHLKDYEQAKKKAGVADYIKQRRQEETSRNVETSSERGSVQQRGQDTRRSVSQRREEGTVGASTRENLTDQELGVVGKIVTQIKGIANKLDLKIVERKNLPGGRDAQYNYETMTIEYDPALLAGRGKDEAEAVLREEIIHAAMHKVILRKNKGLSPSEAFVKTMERIGQALTPEQRDRLNEAYGQELGATNAGAEYTRVITQQILYGETTESFMLTGKAFEMVKSLLRAVHSTLVRALKADINTNDEVALLISDTAKLIRSADPNATVPFPSQTSRAENRADQIAGGETTAETIADPTNDDPEKIAKKKKSIMGKLLLKDIFYTPSRVLQEISSKLYQIMQSWQQNIMKKSLDARNLAKPFFKKLKNIPEQDRKKLERYLMYSPDKDQKNTKEAKEIIAERDKLLTKYGLFNEFQLTIQPIYETIYAEKKASGSKMGYLYEYFPRFIKDMQSYLVYLGKNITADFSSYLEEENQKRFEKGEARIDINSAYAAVVFNTYITSQRYKKLRSIIPQTESRKVDLIDEEAMKYYYSPAEAFNKYIDSSYREIETNKLLGTVGGTNLNIEKLQQAIQNGMNIGTFGRAIVELSQDPNVDQQRLFIEAPHIINTMIGPSSSPAIDFLGGMNSFAYGALMVEPTSTFSNMYELGFATLENGIFPVIKAMLGDKVRLEEIGVNKEMFSAEYEPDTGGLRKIVDKGLQLTGFKRMDQFIKETTLTVNYNRYKRDAKRAKNHSRYKKLVSELEFRTPEYVDKILYDLQNGTPQSPEVRLFLFSKLAETQPISDLEMPAFVKRHPSAKTLFLMKTFIVKQVNFVFQRYISVITDTTGQFTAAEKAKAIKDFMLLMIYFQLIGIPVDAIKDLIAGRDMYKNDYFFNSLFRIAGISKYNTYEFQRNPTEFATSYFSPVTFQVPLDILGQIMAISNDDTMADPDRIITLLPFSDLWYYRYGAGVESQQRKVYRKGQEDEKPINIESFLNL
jgi:ribosomal protein L20A (L18A)